MSFLRLIKQKDIYWENSKVNLKAKKEKNVSSEQMTKINLPQIAHYSKNDEWADLYHKLINSGWQWSASTSKLAN